jgi:predicted Zn finger-like uncharacterized protein
MILTCPSCGTQYVVKDGAVPPEGRQVRCAACKHSWHQDPGEETAAPAPAEGDAEAAAQYGSAAEPAAVADPEPTEGDENLAEATLIDPRSGPEAEERAYEEATIDGDTGALAGDERATEATEEPAATDTSARSADWDEPPTAEAAPDMFSPFAEDGAVEPRRRSPLATILVLLALLIVLAALFWFFAPAPLKAKLGLSAGDATPLAVVMSHMDRQQLESGNELLTVTGRVINPTGREQDVPPLQAQLTSKSGKIVYSWTIAPPARSLAAGASASFNSAEVNVPPGGDELTISLGQPKA